MLTKEDLKELSQLLDTKLKAELDPLKKDIREVKATLEEHGKILNEHSKILQEHSEILHEHSKILQEHSEILHEHSKILQEHSEILHEHSKILQEHSEILHEHSKMLQEHSQGIREIRLELENEIRPAIQMLVENYVPAAQRYEKDSRRLDQVISDVEVLKKVVSGHSSQIRQLAQA